MSMRLAVGGTAALLHVNWMQNDMTTLSCGSIGAVVPPATVVPYWVTSSLSSEATSLSAGGGTVYMTSICSPHEPI